MRCDCCLREFRSARGWGRLCLACVYRLVVAEIEGARIPGPRGSVGLPVSAGREVRR